MGDETSDRRRISEVVSSVDSDNRGGCEFSSNSAEQSVSETLNVIRSEAEEEEEEEEVACVSDENGNINVQGYSNATVNVLGSIKESVGERNIKDSKDDEHSCVIDVKSSGSGSGGSGGGGGCSNGKLGENLEGERVCRICHLSSDPSSETPPRTTTATITTTTTTGLIQLGCGCKDELGIVHAYCAEAWFKIKGNRQCEICGETAKNITGVGVNRFTEECHEMRSAGSVANSSDRRGRCWRGQPFCNFLMACLVIAFVLPWFFRVNMF